MAAENLMLLTAYPNQQPHLGLVKVDAGPHPLKQVTNVWQGQVPGPLSLPRMGLGDQEAWTWPR